MKTTEKEYFISEVVTPYTNQVQTVTKLVNLSVKTLLACRIHIKTSIEGMEACHDLYPNFIIHTYSLCYKKCFVMTTVIDLTCGTV